MPDTLTYIKNKFALDLNQKSPIVLPIDRNRGLCGLFNELGFKTGAEIGVLNGLYSKWLVVKIKGLKLYCIDAWTFYKEYSELRDQQTMDSLYERAKARLAKFNVEFIKKFSMDAVGDFKDESLDFVYIDANHSFPYVMNDITEWSKKVRRGGIVAGHDYSPYMFEVKKAVDIWTAENNIKLWFLTEKDKSWFYVK